VLAALPANLGIVCRAVARLGRFAAQAPLAVGATKRAVSEGLDRPLAEALEIERGEFVGLFPSDDACERRHHVPGEAAPSWTGR